MSDILTRPDIESQTGHDDPDDVAHVADKDDITRAYVAGTEIVALCGERFIPHRDPTNFPVCSACADIRLQISRRGAN